MKNILTDSQLFDILHGGEIRDEAHCARALEEFNDLLDGLDIGDRQSLQALLTIRHWAKNTPRGRKFFRPKKKSAATRSASCGFGTNRGIPAKRGASCTLSGVFRPPACIVSGDRPEVVEGFHPDRSGGATLCTLPHESHMYFGRTTGELFSTHAGSRSPAANRAGRSP